MSPCFAPVQASGNLARQPESDVTSPGGEGETVPRGARTQFNHGKVENGPPRIARSFGAASMRAAVTFVALRTTMASALTRSAASCSGVRPDLASTLQPSRDSNSMAEAGRSSATTMFTMGSLMKERKLPKYNHALAGESGGRTSWRAPARRTTMVQNARSLGIIQ